MSQLNLQINALAFNDIVSTNNPLIRAFDTTYKIFGVSAVNPESKAYTVFPGSQQVVYDGSRTIALDGTTALSMSQPYVSQPNTYRFSWTGTGTNPVFRTNRALGINTTTVITTAVNGPLATYTSLAGTFASFSGQIDGMVSPIVLTANTAGTAGNSIILTANGVSSISALISAWNIANPSNQVTLTSGNGTQVPDAGTYAIFTGMVAGLNTAVTITANSLGSAGNSIVLVGDGTSNLLTLISNWNTANPANQATLTAGIGTQVPQGSVQASYSGIPTGCATVVTITAIIPGLNGNTAVLTGDGSSSIATLIANWNIANPSNNLILSAGDGSQIPSSGFTMDFAGGVNAAVIALDGAINGSIVLTGGSGSTPMTTTSVQIGDTLMVQSGAGASSTNQGLFTVLAVSTNSITVQNTSASGETFTILDPTQFLVFSNGGSANQPQINDTVVISAGFSPVTQGSYQVTNVAPTWFEINASQQNGLPLETNITPGITGLVFYQAAKKFVLIAAQQQVSALFNAETNNNVLITPAEPNNPERPGLLLKTGVFYKLVIVNSGLYPATLLIATVE